MNLVLCQFFDHALNLFKFHENTLNSLRVMVQTEKYKGE